jgi:hypothetical protein
MNRLQTFQQFLATQSTQIEIGGFIFNLLLAGVLSFILSLVYIRYGHSLSNRRMFAKNFMLIAMTTMVIITIVKSSLALSLGLVGALSIVRFRAAIKEPEELSYLFLNIGLGLGLGADQRIITLVAFTVIVGMILLKNISYRMEENSNLHLTVSSHNPEKIAIDKIIGVLKRHCSGVNLKRLDETREILEASFLIEFADFNQFKKVKEDLQKLSDSVNITFLDNRGMS